MFRSRMARSGERVRWRPLTLVINLEVSLQKGAIMGKNHHMCSKKPIPLHKLQQSLEEESTIRYS